MDFVLVLITILQTGGVASTIEGEYATVSECFEARELVVKTKGRPIVNYQSICVIREIK